MYTKLFTRLFLLIGMIGMFSVPMRAEEVTIGSGTDLQWQRRNQPQPTRRHLRAASGEWQRSESAKGGHSLTATVIN